MDNIVSVVILLYVLPTGYTFKVVQDLVDVADKESILLRSGE
jgi:hypothetical protein